MARSSERNGARLGVHPQANQLRSLAGLADFCGGFFATTARFFIGLETGAEPTLLMSSCRPDTQTFFSRRKISFGMPSRQLDGAVAHRRFRCDRCARWLHPLRWRLRQRGCRVARRACGPLPRETALCRRRRQSKPAARAMASRLRSVRVSSRAVRLSSRWALVEGDHVLDEQRFVALGDLRECGGDVDRIGIVLLLVANDDVAEKRQVAGRQRIGDLLREFGDTFVVDRFGGRQLHRLDLLTGGAFDRAQQMSFARRDEQDRLTAASGAAGATDAVHVCFGVVRNVEIDDVADAFDVQSPRGHVGGDEDVEFAGFQPRDGLFALFLRHVAVQRRCGVAARLQTFREFHRRDARAHEYQHAVERFGFEQPRQRIELVDAGDDPVSLTDRLGGGRTQLDRDFLRDRADTVWRCAG